MKKAGSIVLLLLLCLQIFAQLPPPGESRDYYIQKGDALRKEARLKLGAGVGLIIIGGYFFRQVIVSENNNDDITIPVILVLAGFPVALTSVPAFVNAAKYERRAEMMVQFKLQPPPPGTPSMVKQMPSVGVCLQW